MNLFKDNWIETIFEGRNKEYGAYSMRKNQSKYVLMAFVLGTVIFALLVSIPMISKALSKPVQTEEKAVLVDMATLFEAPKEVDEQLEDVPPPPPEKKEIKSLKDVKRFVEPVVAPENEVTEEIVTQEELKDADVGRENVEGSEDGEIVIDETPKENPKVQEETKLTESAPMSVYSVEVKPEPKGGIKAFYAFIVDNFRTPEVGHDLDVKILVTFVVEKDGSLTNIQVVRDAGYGTGAEAVRILKKADKWKPGIQNGIPVRVSYQLPIIIKVKN